MISPTKTAPTVVTDNLPGERQAFTIKATGKAFRILIDGLYERKEAAVVREIMSNAWDSHVAAGKPDAQIKVTCPTSMDPIFRVRDFGVSMSHEDIMRLYTTIFESTKEATNDQLGQFGLGSKTPFAYTDSFSITAWLNGEKRIYTAHIADDDVPMITHLQTLPQGDEPQGVMISVPVRPADLPTFKREIAHMVMASDVQPELDGMTIPEETFAHVGEGYRVIKDEYRLGSFAVRQGCVIYPSQQFTSNFINYGYTLIVDVPIGSVDVTANREAMSLNDTTKLTVRTRLDEVNKQIQTYVEELNAKFPNRLEAFRAHKTHDGWLRAEIGRRSLKLEPDVPNPRVLGALNCMSTKTKTKPVYHFDNPSQITLLVDNGQPMLRRNMRLGEFYSNNRYRKVAVVKREHLPRIVRVLGIQPNQVRTLQSLPDVQVVRSSNGGATGNAAPKKLAPNTYWTLKTGIKTVNRKVGNTYIGTTEDMLMAGWVLTLKALDLRPDQVVFLTEKQAEAMGAPESMRLEKVLVKRAKAYAAKHDLEARYARQADHDLIDQFSTYWGIRDAIQAKTSARNISSSLMTPLVSVVSDELDKLRPAKVTDFTDADIKIMDILEMRVPSAGALTKADVESTVVSAVKPLMGLIKSADPMADLVKFYIANQ